MKIDFVSSSFWSHRVVKSKKATCIVGASSVRKTMMVRGRRGAHWMSESVIKSVFFGYIFIGMERILSTSGRILPITSWILCEELLRTTTVVTRWSGVRSESD